MSFGLALSGGGSRGAAHVGVLMALEEGGLTPSCVSGASAGALVAGLYACGRSPQELQEMVKRLSTSGGRLLDVDILGIVRATGELLTGMPVTLPGLLRGRRLLRFLERQTRRRRLDEVVLPLFIPAVDLTGGETVAYYGAPRPPRSLRGVRWESDGTVADAILASCSVPAVFSPVRRDAMRLVDGGVTNILPVDLLLAFGERTVIAIDLAEDYASPLGDSLFEVASHSLTIMSSRLRECTVQGERLRIRPKLPPEAGLFTFDLMERCVEAGYLAARELLPLIAELAT
jgi:NTE family protein